MIENMAEFIQAVNTEQGLFQEDAIFDAHLAQINQAPADTLFDYQDPKLLAFLKELCYRKTGLEAYDSQLHAALRLFEGNVIEMKTGEGKTLVAVLASCLHLLNRRKIHILTANDYLAERDYCFAKPVIETLGFQCGFMTSETTQEERVTSEQAHVLYTTSKEIAVNYSHNRKATKKEQLIRNPFDVLIADEADLLFIDDARKELSVGNDYAPDTETFAKAQQFFETLTGGDYKIDGSEAQFYLTDIGTKAAETFFGVANYYAADSLWIRNAIRLAFVANRFFKINVDYIVKNGEIVLISSQTGRLMNAFKMFNGLQQALEQKEGLPLSNVKSHFTMISYQFIYNQYKCKSGMTGTALTEAKELKEIYGLNVVAIPTNKPCRRIDLQDKIFRTKALRDAGVVAKCKELCRSGQPILIGTASIEHSEELARLLDVEGIQYHLLDAKHHQLEAEVIQSAGQIGSVTIATNMAGRGTDIVVPEASLALGGLFVLGTERYSSRRADNQLRGRTGRQGDIGYTQFFTSLEDDVMANLNVKRIQQLMMVMRNAENKDSIDNPAIINLYDKAQVALEGKHFGERKTMLKRSASINTYYTNYFNRKLHFLNNDATPTQILDALLKAYIADKSKVDDVFGKDEFARVDVTRHECKPEVDMEAFYEIFNAYWVRFINTLELMSINMFLDFASVGNRELIYEKKVSDTYTQMILSLKKELIHFLQN